MPRQTRWAIKQSLEQVTTNLVKCQEWTVREGMRFEQVHPDLFAKFCLLVAQLEDSRKLAQELYEVI